MKQLLKKIFAIFINDPSDHYYYREPIDKRGSTTYPPVDSGPSDFAIYSCLILAVVSLIVLCKKFKKH